VTTIKVACDIFGDAIPGKSVKEVIR